MAAINEFATKNIRAGIVKMTGGLVRPTKGIDLNCEKGKVTVTDGPFAETKELIDGFPLVEVGSREEAVRLATEFMQLAGDGTGEVLQVFDQAESPAGQSMMTKSCWVLSSNTSEHLSSGVTASLSSVCDAGRSHRFSRRRSLISAFWTVHLRFGVGVEDVRRGARPRLLRPTALLTSSMLICFGLRFQQLV
jgi:hypothetical protein